MKRFTPADMSAGVQDLYPLSLELERILGLLTRWGCLLWKGSADTVEPSFRAPADVSATVNERDSDFCEREVFFFK